ncbi:hypothetical protein [Salana multivorans]
MARGHGRRQQPHDRHGEAERRRRAQERRSAQHTEASVEPPFQLPINTEFESSVRLSLEQGLLDSLDQALDSGPERFLAFASSMAQEMSEPTNALVASERNPDLPSLEEFIHALRTVGVRQTDSFLLVLAEMVKDEVLRAAVRKEVAARRLPVAGWLLRLKNLRPVRAGRMVDAWGDASNIVIELDFPTRQPLSLIALVDGTVGTSLKDAFLGPVTVNEFLARASADPDELDDQIVTELVSLADARAWLEAGIENGDHAFPPFETDTWPGIRPVVEWMLRLMPEGGQAPGWSELTEARREAVQNAFAGYHMLHASPQPIGTTPRTSPGSSWTSRPVSAMATRSSGARCASRSSSRTGSCARSSPTRRTSAPFRPCCAHSSSLPTPSGISRGT